MPGARRASTRKSSPGAAAITSFFKKEDSKGKEEGPEEKISPSKTSDYESDPSRSNTPNADLSRSNSPQDLENTKEEVKEEVKSEPESVELDIKVEPSSSQSSVKRGVAKEEEDAEEEEEDIFAEVKEENDDKEDVKAAIQSGLLSEEVKKEEERFKAETARMERQEEARKQQLLVKEAKEMSTKQRFERLQKLLGKSKFYSQFLLDKMKQEAAKSLKEAAKENRTKKRAQESKTEDEPKKGRKRGRAKVEDDDSPSKKAKLDASGDLGKARKDPDRKFEGKDIPANQPLLLTGGIMRSYQLEGYEWMATLWENGINGILADEMGLGKTIQTIALICHLVEMGIPGPFLVVAPLSTIENWKREFNRFAPSLPCQIYHGKSQFQGFIY